MKQKTSHSKNFAVVSGDGAVIDQRNRRSRERWERVSQTLELEPAPLHVDIELTNICDLKCEMCERRLMKRPLGMMTKETFQTIIDECKDIGVDSVKLSGWGESLLHKDLIEMIRYAKENSELILHFNTNANQMTDKISEGIVDAGLDKLTISLDGISKKTYEKVRRGGKFEKVRGNIDSLLDVKKQNKSFLPVVTLQIIRMSITEHEVDLFVDYWKDRVDYVSVTNIGATTSDEKILSLSLREKKRVGFKPCEQLWQRFTIFWDGTVTVCCNDFDGYLAVGKVGVDSLIDLWRGEKLTNLRKRHKDLNFDGLVCGKCANIVRYNDGKKQSV
jgi:uncharacterized radical SAM superfamily protein